MPASVGPIHRVLDRRLLQIVCGSLSMVLREELSLANSTEIPRLIDLRHCPDVAFYGNGRTPNARESRFGLTARIVVMDWQWSRSVDPTRMSNYIRRMAALVQGLVEKGFSVELGGHSVIPEHGQDDFVICLMRLSRAGSVPVKIDRNADVGHLWKRYRDVDVVVGTRLHACIMAVSVETPCVVLAYQEKGEAVMLTAGASGSGFPRGRLRSEGNCGCV